MTLLEFMSEHPILTFFLALTVGDVVIESVKAIFGRKVELTKREVTKAGK